MAFKMKGSPMKRNFDVGSSPAKHKMEAHERYHGAGGIGWVDEVTAEQVKAHDDTHGEGHDTHETRSSKIGKAAVATAKELQKKKKRAKAASGVVKGLTKIAKKKKTK